MTHVVMSELCRARMAACAHFAALPLVRSVALRSARLPSDSRYALIVAHPFTLDLHNSWCGETRIQGELLETRGPLVIQSMYSNAWYHALRTSRTWREIYSRRQLLSLGLFRVLVRVG